MKEKCSFPGCGLDSRAKGLCNGHYQQQHKGQPLKPLPRRKTPKPILNGHRECSDCGRIKNYPADFYRKGPDRYSSDCRTCYSNKQK